MIATNQKSRRKNVVINFEIKLENAADNLRRGEDTRAPVYERGAEPERVAAGSGDQSEVLRRRKGNESAPEIVPGRNPLQGYPKNTTLTMRCPLGRFKTPSKNLSAPWKNNTQCQPKRHEVKNKRN